MRDSFAMVAQQLRLKSTRVELAGRLTESPPWPTRTGPVKIRAVPPRKARSVPKSGSPGAKW